MKNNGFSKEQWLAKLNEEQWLGITHPEDIACINHLVPIIICHLEGRPWNVLHNVVIAAQCGDGAVHLIHRC